MVVDVRVRVCVCVCVWYKCVCSCLCVWAKVCRVEKGHGFMLGGQQCGLTCDFILAVKIFSVLATKCSFH